MDPLHSTDQGEVDFLEAAPENWIGVGGRFGRQFRALTERFIVGWGGYPLVGTPEQVVEEMGRLADIGVDILLLSWLDYLPELRHFGAEVLPLMQQAGLRAPI